MAYLAFYRTFRPSTFDEVVRQEHVVRILKNQITGGKVGHAYLFCGPRGTGKTTLAKIFAKAINCEHPVNGSPCGVCATCRALAGGNSLDISEIDAASNNGVDEMRDLREKVQYPPVAGRYKVYIIDEVHMLTQSAFNAVLKTLEEPPAHAVFILATTEPQKIPATILSRCMRFDFKLIPQSDLEALVKSVYDKVGKEYEEEAVSAIARAGAGSARDCLSIADTCASYSQGKLTYNDVNAVLGSADFSLVSEIVANILGADASSALSGVENVLSTGKSLGVLVRDLLNYLNNLAIVKLCANAKQILNLPNDRFAELKRVADIADGHKILRTTEILAAAEGALRYSLNGRITLETAVLKCAMPESDYNIDALLGRMSALEKKLEEGVRVQIAAAPKAEVKSEPALPKEEEPKPTAKSSGVRLTEEASASPFEEPEPPQPNIKKEEDVQPTLWEQDAAQAPAAALSEADKKSVFARFLRLFRTTRRNAVLFTLCMDLESSFEGDKFILSTPVEAVYKSLTRAENEKIISDALLSLGVLSHEIRLTAKGEDKFERAVKELKENFNGTDINIR